MRINDATNITLISIFTNAVTSIGNAVVSVMTDPEACVDDSIQSQIKGIFVFNLVPQQTSLREHN
jgi:hypothetical protein